MIRYLTLIFQKDSENFNLKRMGPQDQRTIINVK